MRHLSKIIVVAALLAIASTAQAELLGLEIGAAGWRSAPSGWFEDEGSGGVGRADLERDLHLDSETVGFAWVRIKHPIPVLPNVKVTYTPLKFDGSGAVASGFEFDGVDFGGESVDAETKLNQYDITLFYELLDNVVHLDLGLNVKVLDGYVDVASQTDPAKSEKLDFSGPVPMLYANAGLALPFSGLSLTAEGSGVAYSGNRLLDLKAGLRYHPLSVVAVEAGYRTLQLKLDDIDDISADIKVNGPYLGVLAKF